MSFHELQFCSLGLALTFFTPPQRGIIPQAMSTEAMCESLFSPLPDLNLILLFAEGKTFFHPTPPLKLRGKTLQG